MQKVVSISLNGNSYQLEEPGFDQLRAYLERAESRLKDSPDRAEVMADLEQAISEKCRATLGPHKTVVNTNEVERIIAEMGPVESADQKAASSGEGESTGPDASSFTPPPRKRLFQIREGAVWTGVCNGIAAYLNVDVTWVRLAFVLLTIFSSGLWLVVYFVLMFIVPVATTAEERAAAFGMPFNTEELINRAKKNFEEFGKKYRWRREWRRQQRHLNRQFRGMNEQIRAATGQMAQQVPPMGSGFVALFLPVAAMIGAALFVGWILATFSLITQHSIFGWHLPHNIPLWIGILALAVIYFIVSAPLKFVRHRGNCYHAGWGALHGLIWLAGTVLLLWGAYHLFPGIREIVDQLMWAANLTVTTISETIV